MRYALVIIAVVIVLTSILFFILQTNYNTLLPVSKSLRGVSRENLTTITSNSLNTLGETNIAKTAPITRSVQSELRTLSKVLSESPTKSTITPYSMGTAVSTTTTKLKYIYKLIMGSERISCKNLSLKSISSPNVNTSYITVKKPIAISDIRASSVYVNKNYLIISVHGLIHSVSIYKLTEKLPSLIILPLHTRSNNTVEADYTFVNNSLMVMVINISKILTRLPDGIYRMIVWSGYRWNPEEVLTTTLSISKSRLRLGKTIVHEERIVRIICEGGEYGEEVANYITSMYCFHRLDILKTLRNIVLKRGLSISKKLTTTVWNTLKWVSEHVSYDVEKERRGIIYINNPLTTLNRGKGVCIDYSVLISSILHSFNLSPTYIISIRKYNHAVAALSMNGEIFILDQHLPPIPLLNYLELVLNDLNVRADIIQVNTKNNDVELEIISDIKLKNLQGNTTSNKLDMRLLTCLINNELSKLIQGTVIEPSLQGLISSKLLRAELKIYMPPLWGIGGTHAYIPLLKFFDTTFLSEWVRYLAQKSKYLLLKYFNDTLKTNTAKYVWVSIGNSSLYAAVTPYKPPLINLSIFNGDATIRISSNIIINRLSIVIYDLNSLNPVIGIAPTMYNYSNVRTIHATKWMVKGGEATIEFKISELARSLKINKWYSVGVWINGKLMYGFLIKVRVYGKV